MNDSRTIETEPFITVEFVHHSSIFRIVPLHWAILQCGLNRYTACRNLNCTESVNRLFLGFPSFDVQHWRKKQSIWQSDISTCVVNALYKASFHPWYCQFWTDLLGRTVNTRLAETSLLRTPRYYGQQQNPRRKLQTRVRNRGSLFQSKVLTEVNSRYYRLSLLRTYGHFDVIIIVSSE